MSRGRAKELLSMDEFANSMKGIYTTSVNESTIDEAPQAYKSMEEIKRLITDTVDIVDKKKHIYNFKAKELIKGVQEIRQKKQELSSIIAKLLNNFEDETSVCISSVGFVRRESYDELGREIGKEYVVEVEIKL